MIDDNLIIDALVEIGNAPKFMKLCEPSVMQPLKLEKWMVVRVLTAWRLFEDEWERLPEKMDDEL